MESFIITVQHGLPHLVVQASGPATLADLCAYMDLVGALAARTPYRRVLMDLLAVDIQYSFTDHLTLGAHAAKTLAGLERVASVVNQKYRTGTSEKAAQNMGLHLRTFTALDEGSAWLRE